MTMDIDHTSNTTDQVPSAPQVRVREQVAYNPEINVQVNANQAVQQVLQSTSIQQGVASAQRIVRLHNGGQSNTCCYFCSYGNHGIYQFDSEVPCQLESIGLSEQLFGECIDQINNAMNDLFSVSRKLSMFSAFLLFVGINVSIASIITSNITRSSGLIFLI